MSDEKTTAADAAAEHALAEADAARAAQEGVLAGDEDSAVTAEDAAAAAEAKVQADKDALTASPSDTLSAPQAASDGGTEQSDEQAPDPAPDSAPEEAPEEAPAAPEAPAETSPAGTFDPSTPAQVDSTGLTPAQHTEEVPEGAFIETEGDANVVPSGISPDPEQQEGGTLPPV